MKKVNCIIVDDEQWARDMLELYVQKIPDLFLIKKCKNTDEVQSLLLSQKIDLIFLDVQMPGQSGIEYLQQLPHPPMVVFTTAYSDYALQGYELEVIDYLLKPISFERFSRAVEKAIIHFENSEKAKAFDQIKTFEDLHILIKKGHNHHKLFLKDIVYIAGMKEYVQYHTVDNKFMELKAMKELEAALPETHFIRIHKSYIIAKDRIKGQEKNSILLTDGMTLPMGKTYKQRVLRELF